MKRKIKNILVTGGLGFIGFSFIRFLIEKKKDFLIVNLDKVSYASNEKYSKDLEKSDNYIFIKGDICNAVLVEGILDKYSIDTIVHFAAESHVDNSIKSPKVFLDTNIYGTFILLEAIRKIHEKRKNIHFHHVSTDEVYGSCEKSFFSESSKYFPSSPYAATKAASDLLVFSYYKTYGISITVSYSSNNYGPYQHKEKFIPKIIDSCLSLKEIPIYGNGENIRNWIYVEDHVNAIYTILKKANKGDFFNISSDVEKNNLEIVKEICINFSKIFMHSFDKCYSLITFVEDRKGHDFRYGIDSHKIRKKLLWKPIYSFEKSISKTIKWYIDQEKFPI